VVHTNKAKNGSRLARTLAALVIVLASLALVGNALAAAIVSPGPLTKIVIGTQLNCQVYHASDGTVGEWYPTTDVGACGTFLYDINGNTRYSPPSIPAGSQSVGTPFTPVSQTGPTGSGTSADPYKIVTVVGLGTSGLQIRQTDTYVTGEESYRTDVQISNSTGTAKPVRHWSAGDCFLQASDFGFGRVDVTPFGNAIACTASQQANSRIEQLYPLTSGSHYMEAFYSAIWTRIANNLAGPDTCDCATFEDNGILLSWDVTVPANGSITVSHLTTFSPLGVTPLSMTKTADSSTSAPGATNGYTITIHNPNSGPVTVTSITDTLPAGFSYVAGSTTGATTNNPSISGQVLTWSGSFPVAGGGNLTLHFNVHVTSTPGTYYDEADATANGVAVVPTGPTAPITVTGGPIDTTGPTCAIIQKLAGPPVQLRIGVRDMQSGLATIQVTNSTNADTVVPPFTVTTTTQVVVTSTKINQSLSSTVQLRVTDVAGNVTVCDPVADLVVRDSGSSAASTYNGLAAAEHYVSITNGSPGVQRLDVTVNGHTWKLTGLKANEERTLNVASAMRAGSNNTVSVKAYGRPGGSALVVISD
jgi:uncharacterized repeat protein (TIGR01451 family)